MLKTTVNSNNCHQAVGGGLTTFGMAFIKLVQDCVFSLSLSLSLSHTHTNSHTNTGLIRLMCWVLVAKFSSLFFFSHSFFKSQRLPPPPPPPARLSTTIPSLLLQSEEGFSRQQRQGRKTDETSSRSWAAMIKVPSQPSNIPPSFHFFHRLTSGSRPG